LSLGRRARGAARLYRQGWPVVLRFGIVERSIMLPVVTASGFLGSFPEGGSNRTFVEAGCEAKMASDKRARSL
jgi:hypothetical protein